jgi:hypothetical protein
MEDHAWSSGENVRNRTTPQDRPVRGPWVWWSPTATPSVVHSEGAPLPSGARTWLTVLKGLASIDGVIMFRHDLDRMRGNHLCSIALQFRGLVAVLFLSSALSADAVRSLPLRLAISDLLQTYGAEYARGHEFLERLDHWERAFEDPAAAASSAAWVELQREALLAHPLLQRHPILFVVRHQYRPDHHNTATFFPSARGEYNDGAFTPGGALKLLDLARGGQVTTLLEVTEGVIRDPEVHFDGDRIVFALRRDLADSYHLYEVRTDGTGLKQLTFVAEADDFDPLYLPDDSIVFSSTREPKYCMCNRHIMANLFRMEADGANIHQIGKSTLFEGHASLMPDGRILYDRWEYVDRNFGDAQALWTVHPDGTGHAIYWGNYTASPGAVIDARMVPGTELGPERLQFLP